MSWQAYVDNLLQTKTMIHAGIFGLDGSTWAASPGFPLPADQIKSVLVAITDSGKFQGVTLNGERYIMVRNDPTFCILKKGGNGIVASKSNQGLIVAIHDQAHKAEMVLTHVGKVTDYLTKHGY